MPRLTGNTANLLLETVFPGRKARWLSLYRRLHTRLSQLPGLELLPRLTARGGSIAIQDSSRIAGRIRVTLKGLELELTVGRASGTRARRMRVLLENVSQIDDDLLTWIRAGLRSGRTSKRLST